MSTKNQYAHDGSDHTARAAAVARMNRAIEGVQGQIDEWESLRIRLVRGVVVPGADGITADDAANRVAELFIVKNRYANELRALKREDESSG